MKKFVVGAFALAALGMAAPASAADLAARPYVKAPPPMIAPVYDWTGFYIGPNLGGAWSQRAPDHPATALSAPTCTNCPNRCSS